MESFAQTTGEFACFRGFGERIDDCKERPPLSHKTVM
jgi:hypothetical protein